MKVKSLHIDTDNFDGKLLKFSPNNEEFVGTVIDVNIPTSTTGDGSSFEIISVKDKFGNTIFDVDSTGLVVSRDITTDILNIGSQAKFDGALSLSAMHLSAGDEILLPSSASYVIVDDDEK